MLSVLDAAASAEAGAGTVFGVSAYSSSKASAVKQMLWTRLPLSP